MKSITVSTSPSLALIKYWGKSDTDKNLPATSSLAVTLDNLRTTTTVSFGDSDQVVINEQEADPERFHSFFTNIRNVTSSNARFLAKSAVNFPVAAGIASSSSGFAALALACAQLIDPSITTQTISAFARVGSASAARSVYGGFTILKKDTHYAEPLYLDWPQLRIIIAIVTEETKPISSRQAMETARTTSPFYHSWLKESEKIFSKSLEAVKQKDLKALGPLMRQSYLSMFSTMLTSTPPTIYWKPDSIALIQTCETLRQQGMNIWETMDAGPQVKMICIEEDLDNIMDKLTTAYPLLKFLVSKPGGSPQL